MQWKAVIESVPWNGFPMVTKGDQIAAMCIHWKDAQIFIMRLNSKASAGVTYRLPTEAEWELASRGPESLIYPWGEEEPTCDHVNMTGCSVPPDTQPVGNYFMGNSPDGVWDMSGNVWEWCEDWYIDSYGDTPRDGSANQKVKKKYKVLRGGSWIESPGNLRSAHRLRCTPSITSHLTGFRVSWIP